MCRATARKTSHPPSPLASPAAWPISSPPLVETDSHMGVPCTLIPGDGIGPDITDATVRILDAAGASFEWDRRLAGMAAVEKFDDPMPDETIESIEKTGLALKGPLETPVGGGYRSVNVALRRTFDLYANVRPARSVVPGGRFDKVEIALIREITEGLYSGVEHFIAIGPDPRAAQNRPRSSRATARSGSFVMRSTTRSRTGGRKSRWCTRRTSSR